MTGYGRAEGTVGQAKVLVELRSLNSKQLDLNVRTSTIYKEKEADLRSALAKVLGRGKAELTISREAVNVEKRTEFDAGLIDEYFNELNDIKATVDPSGDTDVLGFVLRMPEVTRTSRAELNDKEWNGVEALLVNAIDEFNSFRTKEGSQLEKDIRVRIDNIGDLLTKVEILDQGRSDSRKARLQEKVGDLQNVEVDRNRLEQELIYYLEKLDITEEKVRLKSHLAFFLENIEKEKPQGKKLGFISQEIGREVNTIGSKANDADIQKAIVQMKDELEKIKEQLLNVL